jgi:hypothetical protein
MEDQSIILEPRTSITSFDGIPWAIQKAVGGAIAALLFGKDKEAKSQFYKSSTQRKNKEVLVQLASQVYSYLNGTISEFADIADYTFRIWTQLKVNRRNGEIKGHPKFHVDIYKFVGSVSAKSVEVADYKLSVDFIGKKDDRFVTPFIQKSLKHAKAQVKHLELEMYNDAVTSPKPMRRKIIGTFPTIILEEKSYAVKSKTDETGKITVFIDENGTPFVLNDENSILLFLAKKSKLKPEIFGYDTAFQPVDQEIKNISNRIKESAEVGEEDFLQNLGLNQFFEKNDSTINSLKKTHNYDRDTVEEFNKKLKVYKGLKIEYETVLEHQEIIQKEFEKQTIPFDMFNATQVKSIMHKKELELQLVDLQNKVKSELMPKVQQLLKNIRVKAKPEKIK